MKVLGTPLARKDVTSVDKPRGRRAQKSRFSG